MYLSLFNTSKEKWFKNLIAERLAIEAKTMLKHTDWNISEIGYRLGFEDASHFNSFLKDMQIYRLQSIELLPIYLIVPIASSKDFLTELLIQKYSDVKIT